jgi:very-short-patch-repair endonuclease
VCADEPDRAVARIAERQRGLVTTVQLLAVGLSRRMIARRVASGRLHRVFHGVYLVGHPVPAPFTMEQAALLLAGPTAALSHHTSGWLDGFLPQPDTTHITVPDRQIRRRPNLHPHRAPLEPHEIHIRDGLRRTTPQRTLRDLASFLDPAALERATHEAQVRGLIPTTIGQPGITRSEAERRLQTLLRRAGLPPTHTNTRVLGFEVDVLYAPQRLIIEVDGLAFHATRFAAERDRRRDAALLAAGYRVLRVTWRQIVETPEALVVQIARALG